MKILPILTLSLVSLTAIQAQEPAAPAAAAAAQPAQRPPLPEGPLLNRAPDMAQWTILHKESAAAASASADKTQPAPAATSSPGDFQALVTKTKDIYHIEIVTGDHRKIDRWVVDGAQVTIASNAAQPMVSIAGRADEFFTDFSKSDFGQVAWVSKKNFMDYRDVSGLKCLVFHDRIRGEGKERIEAQAFIDSTSRLPLLVQAGESSTTFRYGQAPAQMLVPPANVAEMLKLQGLQAKRTMQMPPP